MKEKLDIKQVFSEIKALYHVAELEYNFTPEDYVWVIGWEVLQVLKENANMYFKNNAIGEQETICNIPIMGVDFQNIKKIKLYKEIN